MEEPVAEVKEVNLIVSRRQKLQVGARLLQFHRQWTAITKDKLVLEIVRKGLKIDFISSSPFTGVKETVVPRDGTQKSSILEEVGNLFEKCAIEPVPALTGSHGFYSTLFLVPKKQGGMRPILILKPLNQYVVPQHFKMETLRNILRSLRKGDWVVTLDMKDAYFHIPVHVAHRQFLRFSVFGRQFQYRALPFGLRSAPRIFTKVMSVIGAYLRKRLIYMFMYLDDWMIRNPSRVILTQQLAYTRKLLNNLGILINAEKSCFIPTQTIEYLGAVIHLKQGLVYPSEDRYLFVQQIIYIIRTANYVEARLVLRLLGLMASCIDLIPMLVYT